jgi:hypothetical protein
MTSTCPDCGTAVEVSVRNARLMSGTCSDCGRPLLMIQEVAILEGGNEGPGEGEIGAGRGITTPAADGPQCGKCHAPLGFRATDTGGIESVCSSCGATLTYLPAGSEREEPRFRPADRDRRPPGRGGDREFVSAPATRPCRECGGALRFSTNPDGTVTGECSSCGNRFNLPPRSDSRGRGGGGFGGDRRGGGGYRPGGRREWTPGGGRGRAPSSGGGFRRRPSFGRSDSGDRNDRRRRRSRDDE